MASQSYGQDRILLVFEAAYDNQIMSDSVAENMAEQALIKAGLTVLNQAQLTANKARQQQKLVAIGDIDAALAVDFRQDAEWILAGSVVVESGKAILNGQLKPRNAQVVLSLRSTKTGKIHYSAHHNAKFPHINLMTGAKKAVSKATRPLLDKLVEVLAPVPQRLQVTINNVSFRLVKPILAQLSAQGYDFDLTKFSHNTASLMATQQVKQTPELLEALQTLGVSNGWFDIVLVTQQAIELAFRVNSDLE